MNVLDESVGQVEELILRLTLLLAATALVLGVGATHLGFPG